MRTRSAAVDLTWNGAAVKSKMLGQTTEITYTDPPAERRTAWILRSMTGTANGRWHGCRWQAIRWRPS